MQVETLDISVAWLGLHGQDIICFAALSFGLTIPGVLVSPIKVKLYSINFNKK